VQDHTFTATLQAIYRFKIAQAVPLSGTISIGDLARATSLSEVNTARIIRSAAVHNVFREPTPGLISHSAISCLIAEDEGIYALVGHMTDAAFPASARMCDFLEQFPDSGEPDQNPLSMTFGAPLFGLGPEKMKRFIDAMGAWSSGDGTEGIVQGYDWSKIGKGSVVDVSQHSTSVLLFIQRLMSPQVGGAAGHISLAVAAAFPDLTFTVQDLPSTEPQATALINTFPDSVKTRVSWVTHDFFTPQPEPYRNADVYLLRYICHDWSDLYASKILAATAQSMGPGSRILIADAVLPPPGVGLPKAQEALLRAFDISMLCQLNARERDIENWEALLRMADARLKITDVMSPVKAGEVSIIEVKLT
jgi:hypothetical protein